MKDRLGMLFSVSPFKISIIIIFIVVIFYFVNFPFLNFMELKTLDLRFISRGERAPGDETIIAAIDEKSLTELGRWPWSRGTIGKLVDVLKDSGTKAIGFDVVFAEPDEHAMIGRIEEIEKELKRIGKTDVGISRILNNKKREADTDGILAQ